jgi:hypothetical protein
LVGYFMEHLSHPFQNVRDQVAGILAVLIKLDVPLRGYINARNPTMKDVFGRLSEDLRPLMAVADSPPTEQAKTNGHDSVGPSSTDDAMNVEDGGTEELDEDGSGMELGETDLDVSVGCSDLDIAKRMMDCVTRIALLSVTNSVFSFSAELHELLPLVSFFFPFFLFFFKVRSINGPCIRYFDLLFLPSLNASITPLR